MKEIGNKLSICRQNKNMTQEELAKRLGVTSQAVSKWERGISLPDIGIIKALCMVLEVSADYLLDVQMQKEEKNGVSVEILNHLRNSLESLELVFGRNLVSLFQNNDVKKEILEMRVRLSRQGMILPVVRLRDELLLKDNELMVLAYHNVLYAEEISEEVLDLTYIMKRVEDTVQSQYARILNPDITKLLVDNLKDKYPALIDGFVPEKISYAALTMVMKEFMSRGNGIIYLPKILEYMQYCLLEKPGAGAQELLQAALDGIMVKENIWVYLHERN